MTFSVPRRARPGPTNARTFREQIRKLARSEPPHKWIIVAAEPITDVDTTAADMLRDIDEELNASDVHLVFAARPGAWWTTPDTGDGGRFATRRAAE